MMTIYNLPPFLGAILNLILGITVYKKKKEYSLNKLFLLLSLCFAVWNFGVFLLFSNLPEDKALLWARIVHIAIIWIPPIFLNLVFVTLAIQKGLFFPIIYSLAFIFCIISMTKFFITGVFKIPYSSEVSTFYAQGGPFYPLFLAYFVSILLYAAWKLWQALKSTSGLKHTQIKYLLISQTTAMTGGFNDILPIIGIHKYPLMNACVYPFGSITIIFWSFIIAYAIVKHQLMDIDIVIKKGTVYTYLSFLVLIPCMILIIFAQRFYFDEVNYAFSSLIFALLLLAAIIFSRTKLKVERFIERTLFKEKYEYKEALSKLSKIIISFLDEKKLFKKTSYILTHSLGIEKNSFFLLDREKRAYTLRASRGLDKPKIKELPEGNLFFKWLKESGKIIVKEELERLVDDPKIKPIVETLDSMESEVCIPLITRNDLIGTINLGRKRSGDMYSQEDLELLGNLANQAAVALENARLYDDMKKTQLLMRRSDRLAALGSLTAGLAHEIRNPLVAVKTFLQLLPERFDDEEFRSNFLSLTTSEVERITALVSELLEFARPSEPQLKRANVNEVLQKVIHLITVEAKKRGIAINSNLEEVPQAMLDEEQIKQVFLNIFLNAIEAVSASGDISVTSRMTQKNGLAYVQVRIEDTGKGIPKKILEHIFDPFFTTKEKGSGLGLSISHQIVQEHNGSIEVESKSGKGTTFFVNLPCVK